MLITRYFYLIYSATGLLLRFLLCDCIARRYQSITPLLSAALLSANVLAANQVPDNAPPPDLTDLDLEQLVNLDVTSITKTATDVNEVPAAIFVITSDMIKRSGATNIPEVLRLAPGLHVARIDGNKWAVTIRGFSGQYANKLLVLKDGRTLYTPMFSGVWWDQEDEIMEDIERIEIIRGSGASLWGANAVNGVINIITKSAKATQGGFANGYGGNRRTGGSVRYGVDLGDEAQLKVFGRYSEYDESNLQGSSTNAGDASELKKLGFRFDKTFSASDQLTVQGDYFAGFSGGAEQVFNNLSDILTPVTTPPYSQTIKTDVELQGHYLMGRWAHTVDDETSTLLRMFWSRNERDADLTGNHYTIDMVDTDFQYNTRIGNHSIVWGAGIRLNSNDANDSVSLSWTPTKRTDEIVSLFAQDEIVLQPNTWKLTLGSKFEHNPVTGFEVQPSIRLAYTPNTQHVVWGAVSRAVRTPSWAEQNITYPARIIPPVGGGFASPFNPVTLVAINGNPDVNSEKLLAFELGWRGELSSQISADLALYYFDYEQLMSWTAQPLDFSHLAQGYVVQLLRYTNLGAAQTYGGEASVEWRVNDVWRLRANYSHIGGYFSIDSAASTTQALYAYSVPANQAMLWSMHQLTHDLKLDLNWRYVESYKSVGIPLGDYNELDARLAWQLTPNIELSLTGKNLLNTRHLESGSQLYPVSTPVQRELYGAIRWSF